MKVLDLFAGIGGFTLGLERAGFETAAFCEIDPYAQKVLAKHWPGVPIYDDVRTITAERLASDGIGVDVITGGFPCQDISVAGHQAGLAGERSGLWSECARLLREVRPRYAIFENVTNLLTGERGDWFKRVLWDISEVGYDAEWHCIPASQLGAHHHRDRIWIIAYPHGNALRTEQECQQGSSSSSQSKQPGYAEELLPYPEKLQCDGGKPVRENGDAPSQQSRGCDSEEDASDSMREGLQGREKQGIISFGWEGWEQFSARCVRNFGAISEVEPTICRGANGVSNHAHRLKCLGNAVVPQIPELIGHAIMGATNE